MRHIDSISELIKDDNLKAGLSIININKDNFSSSSQLTKVLHIHIIYR